MSRFGQPIPGSDLFKQEQPDVVDDADNADDGDASPNEGEEEEGEEEEITGVDGQAVPGLSHHPSVGAMISPPRKAPHPARL